MPKGITSPVGVCSALISPPARKLPSTPDCTRSCGWASVTVLPLARWVISHLIKYCLGALGLPRTLGMTVARSNSPAKVSRADERRLRDAGMRSFRGEFKHHRHGCPEGLKHFAVSV